MFENVSLENVRKYWDDRPCNIKHSNAPLCSKNYFREVNDRKYFVEPHIIRFADFGNWHKKKVLEIGCGIGTDSLNFALMGANVTAIDYSNSSLDIAKKRANVFDVKNIKFYHANAEELSQTVPIEEYDLIYSFGVIHHTPHPERVMQEIRKYMNSSSILKIMVYHRNSWKTAGIIAQNPFMPINEAIAKNSEAQTGCPVTYSYTKKSVKALLKGYEITDMFIDHIFPYNIEEYKRYIYKKKWYFKMIPKPLFRFLEKRFGWHLCITARLAYPSVLLPQQQARHLLQPLFA